MAEGIVTTIAKKKMVQARAGIITLPKVKGMAFGDGAVDEEGTVLVASPSDINLKNELLRKEISDKKEISDVCYRYSCVLGIGELSGKIINEIALYDDEEDLIAIKSFSNKGKDQDMEMIFEIDDTF